MADVQDDQKENAENASLIEGVDYTIDAQTGAWVFTTDYLLRRGTCCQSGCRNCPYGFTNP